jgi:hypothetical protein
VGSDGAFKLNKGLLEDLIDQDITCLADVAVPVSRNLWKNGWKGADILGMED